MLLACGAAVFALLAVICFLLWRGLEGQDQVPERLAWRIAIAMGLCAGISIALIMSCVWDMNHLYWSHPKPAEVSKTHLNSP